MKVKLISLDSKNEGATFDNIEKVLHYSNGELALQVKGKKYIDKYLFSYSHMLEITEEKSNN